MNGLTSTSGPREVICALLRNFYTQGWCAGSGGGISIRKSDDEIYVAPSGVQKELVQPEDIYVINVNGDVVENPKNPKLKPSECTPLFNAAYKLRRAGAVLHSHALPAMLVTKLFGTEFQTIDHEMIKGIPNHHNTEWCVVPIIENTEKECELTERLTNAINAYPRSNAVLVRNHGVYIWGENWEKAKIHAECYHYLFEAVVEMKKLGLEIPRTVSSSSQLRAWYIDENAIGQDGDIRESLHYRSYKWVNPDYLATIGVEYWKLDGDENNTELNKICKQRNYASRDQIKCGNHCENYQQMLSNFRKEHIHLDEEIRYIIGGSGYFDVRDHEDKWIRIQSVKGDLIVLPEGIYHRFTTDKKDGVHAMRLFKDEPKWTPYNRPCDDLESRNKYVDQFLKKFQK
ncbi:hypothetical protein ABPG72_013896 [Tetrahymena utriculariae]